MRHQLGILAAIVAGGHAAACGVGVGWDGGRGGQCKAHHKVGVLAGIEAGWHVGGAVQIEAVLGAEGQADGIEAVADDEVQQERHGLRPQALRAHLSRLTSKPVEPLSGHSSTRHATALQVHVSALGAWGASY